VQQQQGPGLLFHLRQHAQDLAEPRAFRLKPQRQRGFAQPRLAQPSRRAASPAS
jgi:hypothetical protein